MEKVKQLLEQARAILEAEGSAEDQILSAIKSWDMVVRKGDDILAAVAAVGEAASKLPDVPEEKRRVAIYDVRQSLDAAKKQVDSLYGAFAEGREALKAAAGVWDIPTKRAATTPKKPSVPLDDKSDDDLKKDLARISKSTLPRDSLEACAKALRILRDNGKKGFPEEDRAAVISAGLDYRDAVSAGWFMWVNSMARRINELIARLEAAAKWEAKGAKSAARDMVFAWSKDPEIADFEAEF